MDVHITRGGLTPEPCTPGKITATQPPSTKYRHNTGNAKGNKENAEILTFSFAFISSQTI